MVLTAILNSRRVLMNWSLMNREIILSWQNSAALYLRKSNNSNRIERPTIWDQLNETSELDNNKIEITGLSTLEALSVFHEVLRCNAKLGWGKLSIVIGLLR